MADADNTETILPLLLRRYRVDGMLGEGGLGTVVKAFDTRLKRLVAIKTLKRSLAAADVELFRAIEERFTREAEAGSRMGVHPHIVTVYDLVVDDDRTQYLILEFIAGGTLAERIAAGRLSLLETLTIAADSATGLQSAHEVGIVHRDVKPSNIFLTATGHAKVGDFGIAQIDAISARTRTVTGHPGTPLYMSPEQAQSTGYVRAESDQYSLGLVLFEMLTGEAYKRLRKGQIEEHLVTFAPVVRAMFERMTASDPENRYASMGEVVEAIEAIRSDLTKPLPVTKARSDEEENATVLAGQVTARATPPINLMPAPPIAPPPAYPATSARHYSRRAILLGAGGLIVGAGGIGGVFAATHRGQSIPLSTATPGRVAANTATPPTAIPASPAVSVIATPTTPAPSTVTLPPTTPTPLTEPVNIPAPTAAPQATPTAPAKGLAPISSLLTYMDGRVALPGEGEYNHEISGGSVRVVGLDLSRGEPLPLPSVTTAEGTRTVRVLWAPKGTLLATLIRQPVPGGFSKNLDLVVTNIATGKSTTVATAINTLAAWSPDGTTLMYGVQTGREQDQQIGDDRPPAGGDDIRLPAGVPNSPRDNGPMGYDLHLINADGTQNRVIAHLQSNQGCGGGGPADPIEAFVGADQFFGGGVSVAWAADGSRVAMTAGVASFTMRPDGTDIKRVGSCSYPDLGNYIGPTTSDVYLPTNGIQVRLVDDADALQWRYERGLMPTTILGGCTAIAGGSKCDNTRKGTPNAGYRNQVLVRFLDGSEQKLTNSSTFKYHVEPSPDGTAIAFTGITVSDYTAASAGFFETFAGYSADVYLLRLGSAAEARLTKTGTGHHPSWQRDIQVKVAPHATATPRPTDVPEPSPTPRPNPTRAPSTPLPSASSTVTWRDPQGRLSLAYPRTWSSVPATDASEIYELDSGDKVHFSVYAVQRPDSIQTGTNEYIARQNRRTDRQYTFDATRTGSLGGVPALFTSFRSSATTGAPAPHTAEVAYASSGGRLFAFEYYTDGTAWLHRDDLDAILNSVTFGR